MPFFDRFIFADWSGRSRKSPVRESPDAVWVGEFERGKQPLETYFRTRIGAFLHVRDLLRDVVIRRLRAIVGFDFAYGYPSGFGYALGLVPANQPSWFYVWARLAQLITDDQKNANNRFQVAGSLNRILNPNPAQNGLGPYWGRSKKNVAGLSRFRPQFPFQTSNGFSLKSLRLTESSISGVQESWKLLGNGSVGSQALLGIPHLLNLITDGALWKNSRVWPFETGFAPQLPASGPYILHAEIWPGVVESQVTPLMRTGLIRDRAQVRCMCQWIADLDDTDQLNSVLSPKNQITAQESTICIKEEGWILGA